MTQESNPTQAPAHDGSASTQRNPSPGEQIPPQGHPSAGHGIPAQGHPPSAEHIPTQGYPPPGQHQGYPPPTQYGPPQAYPPPGPYGPPPGQQGYPPPGWAPPGPSSRPGHGQPSGRGRRPLWIVVGVLAAVVVVLAGVLTWALTSSPAPTAPAPVAAQPAEAPADSPAIAAAARQQFDAAFSRFSQAGIRFGQQAQQAGASNNQELGRAAVTDFRAAAYGFDAEIRRITFPNAQQTVVNTQLLPATGRLVGDLDQLANLDATTMQSAGDRMVNDDRTTVQLSRQILSSLGGI